MDASDVAKLATHVGETLVMVGRMVGNQALVNEGNAVLALAANTDEINAVFVGCQSAVAIGQRLLAWLLDQGHMAAHKFLTTGTN